MRRFVGIGDEVVEPESVESREVLFAMVSGALRADAGSVVISKTADRAKKLGDNHICSVEAETTVTSCSKCGESFRICGKDGTSIGYVCHCPYCGDERVDTMDEIIDIGSGDEDYYAEDVEIEGE